MIRADTMIRADASIARMRRTGTATFYQAAAPGARDLDALPPEQKHLDDVYPVETPVLLTRRSRPWESFDDHQNAKSKPIGGNVSPVYRSQPSADENVTQDESGRQRGRPQATPPESPGVFVVQPLERWSLIDVVGLTRAGRGTGTAIGRGVATS
jgi:hypothetical protein